MGPHLTTTYVPTSSPIFSSKTSSWGLELRECVPGLQKKQGVGGDRTLVELSLGRLASV